MTGGPRLETLPGLERPKSCEAIDTLTNALVRAERLSKRLPTGFCTGLEGHLDIDLLLYTRQHYGKGENAYGFNREQNILFGAGIESAKLAFFVNSDAAPSAPQLTLVGYRLIDLIAVAERRSDISESTINKVLMETASFMNSCR